jgi:GDP-D-mannose 3', 5'-epimerase
MSDHIRKALVCGAGGFIGSHLVKRLKSEGFWVRGVDIKRPEFDLTHTDEFIVGNLRDMVLCRKVVAGMEDVYQLAADMGGAGYIFTGDHDAAIVHSSALINLNMNHAAAEQRVRRIFYSSSACIYPAYNQQDPVNPNCAEDSSTPRPPIAITGGKSFSVSDSIWLTSAISESLYASALPQYFRPRRCLGRRAGKSSRRLMPESGTGS